MPGAAESRSGQCPADLTQVPECWPPLWPVSSHTPPQFFGCALAAIQPLTPASLLRASSCAHSPPTLDSSSPVIPQSRLRPTVLCVHSHPSIRPSLLRCSLEGGVWFLCGHFAGSSQESKLFLSADSTSLDDTVQEAPAQHEDSGASRSWRKR